MARSPVRGVSALPQRWRWLPAPPARCQTALSTVSALLHGRVLFPQHAGARRPLPAGSHAYRRPESRAEVGCLYGLALHLPPPVEQSLSTMTAAGQLTPKLA